MTRTTEGTEGTILIVDDDASNLAVLFDGLRATNFTVLVAERPSIALRELAYSRPDVALLDIHLPEMDGFALCRRIRALPQLQDLPVIFITAYDDLDAKLKGFELNAVDFISKPFLMQEVAARVRQHLKIRRLQQQLQEENDRFRCLEEATFKGLVIHDGAHILEVNARLAAWLDYSGSDLRGQSPFDFVAAEYQETVKTHLQNQSEEQYRIDLVRRDGSRLPVEIQARPMRYRERAAYVMAVHDLSPQIRLERENRALKTELRDRYRFGDIIGKSPVMQTLYAELAHAAACDLPVLLNGESGTGKELAARTIHRLSARAHGPFVPVNCGAIPAPLFESAMFGHRKGAFTGADHSHAGLFAAAQAGTLFLDEIHTLTPDLQVKLLRVLQEREFRPVGATTVMKANLRLIAATNADLAALRAQGRIRDDFFYRISVLTITLPPLRERAEDIPLLIGEFLADAGQPDRILPKPVMQALRAYAWPGNVRELQAELQRYLVLERLTIPAADASRALPPAAPLNLPEAVAALEQQLITAALTQTHDDRGKAAELLGIDRKTLYRKLKALGQDAP